MELTLEDRIVQVLKDHGVYDPALDTADEGLRVRALRTLARELLKVLAGLR